MNAAKFNLPPTDQPPDNVYFDGDVVSWNFTVDGLKATLGFIRPGFDGTFPVGEGGEKITLVNPGEGTGLNILVLDGDKPLGAVFLNENVDTNFVQGGRNIRVVARGDKVVEYVCVYPGQPADDK